MKEENQTKTMRNRVILPVMILLVTVIMLLTTLLSPKREFSVKENRFLEKLPEVSLKTLLTGEYGKKAETYIEDHFSVRNPLIGLDSFSKRTVGRESISDVYVNDRQMFIQKFNRNTDEMTGRKADAVNRFAALFPDIPKSFLLIPNKVEIYSDKLPLLNDEDSQKDFIGHFYGLLDKNISTLDVTDVLKEKKEDYLYFNTDHHWTQTGAYTAFTAWLERIHGICPQTEYERLSVSSGFNGTLASKTGIMTSGDTIELFIPKNKSAAVVNIPEDKVRKSGFYDLPKLNEKDQYLTFLGGNYSIVRISTESPTGRSILIIKDSYANAFVPFLAEEYSDITMVDLRYFSGNIYRLMENYSFDEILFLFNVNTFSDDSSILTLTTWLGADGKPIMEE